MESKNWNYKPKPRISLEDMKIKHYWVRWGILPTISPQPNFGLNLLLTKPKPIIKRYKK